MKRGFIRGLWGVFDTSDRFKKRRFGIENDIEVIQKNKFNTPFRTYIMGDDNYECFKKYGFSDAVLINKDPFKFDLVKHQYRNKIEIIQHAFENDGYDELVYLDWDCVPQKKLLDTFWEEMGKKESIQANLQQYKRRQCSWRTVEQRKVPNGGFLYIRDKKIADLAVKKWESLGENFNDELSWASITDDMSGGWNGIENYWKNFESMFSNLHKGSPYSEDLLKSKDVYFVHYQGK